MSAKTILRRVFTRELLLHLIAMLVVVAAFVIGAALWLSNYTHHGEELTLPDVRHRPLAEAVRILEDAGVEVAVSDTGYVKTLPAGVVLKQQPDAGQTIKGGRTVYLVINSAHSPTLALPDIVDNCSHHEARAKLTAMGFLLGATEYVAGEKDWVYGVKAHGQLLRSGDRIAAGETLTLQVGSGLITDEDTTEVSLDDWLYSDDEDDFEVIL